MKPLYHLVDLPENVDSRGALSFAQYPNQIPFAPMRIFMIYGVPPGSKRGGHAHRVQQQCFIMMHGAMTVAMSDGVHREELRLTKPSTALCIPPLVWLDIGDFSEGAVCAVLASAGYDESDYIRDHAEFLRLAGAAAGR